MASSQIDAYLLAIILHFYRAAPAFLPYRNHIEDTLLEHTREFSFTFTDCQSTKNVIICELDGRIQAFFVIIVYVLILIEGE